MRRVIALLTVAVAACGTGDGGKWVPSGPGQITLGSIAKDGTWKSLSDGEEVKLEPGAQGGFHVWMKFRAHDVPPGDLTMLRTARRLTDNKLVLKSSGAQKMGAPGDDGLWELPAAVPMFMCPSPIGLSVVDLPIVFSIVLQDPAGKTIAENEITLLPRCPDDARAFCEKICTG
ncbi:MAG: hypothetical protein EXR72_01395 [Myxococcales bacterium]|nr:hypothetical protein [Myxococcales bacterium]